MLPEPATEIRRLTIDDTGAFYALRLRGLEESPAAFGTATRDFAARGPADVRARLQEPAVGVFGAFDRSGLVGVVGVRRAEGEKVDHQATIWGMYVAPEARGRGIGRALLEHAVDHLRGLGGVRQVNLGVGARNEPAKRLYDAVGFVVWGIEPRSLRIGDRFVDEEYRVLHLDGYPAA